MSHTVEGLRSHLNNQHPDDVKLPAGKVALVALHDRLHADADDNGWPEGDGSPFHAPHRHLD